MSPREVFLTNSALRVLEGAGTPGVGREAWMDQTSILAQSPLTTAEQDALIERVLRNGWVQSYRDPILEQVRYVLSGPGSLALGVL